MEWVIGFAVVVGVWFGVTFRNRQCVECGEYRGHADWCSGRKRF
jgi:hypothetical protein